MIGLRLRKIIEYWLLFVGKSFQRKELKLKDDLDFKARRPSNKNKLLYHFAYFYSSVIYNIQQYY